MPLLRRSLRTRLPLSRTRTAHREDDVKGYFREYLPAFNRDTLVAAVQDGFMIPATRALHTPLRLWSLDRRQEA